MLITDKAGASSCSKRTVSNVRATNETADDVLHPSLGIVSSKSISGGTKPWSDFKDSGPPSSPFWMDAVAEEAAEMALSSPINAILRLSLVKRVLPIMKSSSETDFSLWSVRSSVTPFMVCSWCIPCQASLSAQAGEKFLEASDMANLWPFCTIMDSRPARYSRNRLFKRTRSEKSSLHNSSSMISNILSWFRIRHFPLNETKGKQAPVSSKLVRAWQDKPIPPV